MKNHVFRITVLFIITVLVFPSASAETVIDYHKAPQLLIDTYGQRIVDEACQVIDAFLEGASSAVLEEYVIGDIPKLRNALFVMCPVFGAYSYVGYDCFDENTNTFFWEKCCTDEVRAANIQAFEEKVLTYFTDLQVNDTELMKSLVIYYRYVSTHVYDEERIRSNGSTDHAEAAYRDSSAYAILEDTGYCNNYSAALCFLYTQAGINSLPVGGSSKINEVHAWNLVQVDGEYYFMDATWDLLDDEQYCGLMYFGLTAAEREEYGGYALKDVLLCANYYDGDISQYPIQNDRFYDLHYYSFYGITDLTLDHENKLITVTNKDGITNILQ